MIFSEFFNKSNSRGERENAEKMQQMNRYLGYSDFSQRRNQRYTGEERDN